MAMREMTQAGDTPACVISRIAIERR